MSSSSFSVVWSVPPAVQLAGFFVYGGINWRLDGLAFPLELSHGRLSQEGNVLIGKLRWTCQPWRARTSGGILWWLMWPWSARCPSRKRSFHDGKRPDTQLGSQQSRSTYIKVGGFPPALAYLKWSEMIWNVFLLYIFQRMYLSEDICYHPRW